MSGGSGSATYVSPFGKGLQRGGIDQGIDYSGAGKLFALGDAVIERVAAQGSGTGWPGAGGNGTGAMIVYRLTSGPRAGQRVYLAENVDPVAGLKAGDKVAAGQPIATARGAYPYLETGWAADASGTTLTAKNNPEQIPGRHTYGTSAGRDFASFIAGLSGAGQNPFVVNGQKVTTGDQFAQAVNPNDPVRDPLGAVTGAVGGLAGDVAKGVVGLIWDAVGADAMRALLYVVLVGGGLAMSYHGLNRTLAGGPAAALASVRDTTTKGTA